MFSSGVSSYLQWKVENNSAAQLIINLQEFSVTLYLFVTKKQNMLVTHWPHCQFLFCNFLIIRAEKYRIIHSHHAVFFQFCPLNFPPWKWSKVNWVGYICRICVLRSRMSLSTCPQVQQTSTSFIFPALLYLGVKSTN